MKLKRTKTTEPTPNRIKAVDIVRAPEVEQDEIPFDPHRDIIAEDWAGLMETLESYREKRIAAAYFFAGIAMPISLLFPERRDELNLDDTCWEGMQGYLESCRKNAKWAEFIRHATRICLLFPERRDELNLDDTVWEQIKGSLEWSRKNTDWWKFSGTAIRISLIFPEERDALNLDDTAWQGMKEQLEVASFRERPRWISFAKFALNMTILAAEKVEITADGQIKITPKKSPLAEPTPLPNRTIL